MFCVADFLCIALNLISQRSLNIRIRLSGIQCISRFCDCVRVLHRSFGQPLINLTLRRLEVLIDHRLYRSISEEYRGQFGTVTLTFPQTLVLSLLSAEGPMPISELAKATGSANSTISGVLDRLEQMELIQRIRSEKDRRVVYVALAPHYEDVREEIESSVLRKFPDLIGRMSPEEIEQIQTGLAVLEKALSRPG